MSHDMTCDEVRERTVDLLRAGKDPRRDVAHQHEQNHPRDGPGDSGRQAPGLRLIGRDHCLEQLLEYWHRCFEGLGLALELRQCGSQLQVDRL